MIRTAQRAYRAIRKKLLISCASAALATAALAPQKAKAQAAPTGAFQGNVVAASGATRTITGDGTETINVTSSTATIDWNPLGQINQDGNMVFLPDGSVATFQGDSNAGNYTVLNRIVTDGAVPIEFDGRVESFLDGGSTGGKIWFYSPNGIVIGSTAVFDVRSLLPTPPEPKRPDAGNERGTAT